jgi:hypothetical protein
VKAARREQRVKFPFEPVFNLAATLPTFLPDVLLKVKPDSAADRVRVVVGAAKLSVVA